MFPKFFLRLLGRGKPKMWICKLISENPS
jgi:hypothetical protein